MDNKVNYTVVGLFVVVLSVALFAIVIWLSNWGKQEKRDYYVVYMHESVSGLMPQAPVSFNGVKVGQVQSIALNKDDPQLVRIVLAVEHGTPINQSTVATLKSQGITGVTYVGLSATKAKAPAIAIIKGQKYPVIPSKPSLLETLSDTLQDSAKHITELTESMRNIVDEKNQKAIAATLQHIQSITMNLADNEARFNNIISKVNVLSTNLAKASSRFPNAMDEVNKTLAQLQSMSLTITKTGKTMDRTLISSQAMVQNFQEQLMPSATRMLDKMNTIANNIKGLTGELTENPSILVRGQTPKKLGPGEQ